MRCYPRHSLQFEFNEVKRLLTQTKNISTLQRNITESTTLTFITCRIQSKFTQHLNNQKTVILFLEKRQIETNFEMIQILDSAEKCFKAFFIMMFKKLKENMLVINKNRKSQQRK